MAEGRRYDVVLMDWRMPDLDGLSAAQLIRQLQGDLPPPMVIAITAYGREVLADARDHSAPPFVDFLTSRSRPSNWPTRCCMRCTANRAPRPTRRRARWSAPSELGVRLLVVEDNALNRQVAAELLSSEGARAPRRRRAGGRSAGAGGERAVRRGADGHADAGYRWSPRRPGESAPTGASPGCRSRHDRQRLAGRPRSLWRRA